jgi:aromatase
MAVRTDQSVTIDAPLEVVWERLNDLENWTDLFDEYASVEILEREGNTTRFRLTTHPDPDFDETVWSWVSERTIDPETHTVRARRIETGNYEYMNIEWSFEPADGGGTQMRWVQDFTLRPTAPTNDEEARDYIDRNSRKQMAILKERIEESVRRSRGSSL